MLNFEWDQEKATSNKMKHNISFYEAATIFADPLADTFIDPDIAEFYKDEKSVNNALRLLMDIAKKQISSH